MTSTRCSQRWSRRAAAGIALLAVTALTACGAATTPLAATAPSPSTTTAEQPGAREATPEEQRQSDIDVVRQFHPEATDEQAMAYNAAAQATMQLNSVLDTEHADVYAWSEVTDDLVYTPTVHLKGADAAALATIKAAGVPNLTIDTGAKYTAREVQAITAAAFDPVSQRQLTTSMSGGYDWATDSVTIEVEPKPGTTYGQVIEGTARTVSPPGVFDAGGGPANTPVRYVQFDGVRFD